MVNYVGYDIASGKRRVVTVAHPLNVRGRLEGVVFWEYDLAATFTNLMVPWSFETKKYPFIQYRVPQLPSKELYSIEQTNTTTDRGVEMATKLKYPSVNTKFSMDK